MRQPIVYIDPPTIPEGMSIGTYRRIRADERAHQLHGIHRIPLLRRAA